MTASKPKNLNKIRQNQIQLPMSDAGETFVFNKNYNTQEVSIFNNKYTSYQSITISKIKYNENKKVSQ